MERGVWQATDMAVHGVAESQTQLSDFHFTASNSSGAGSRSNSSSRMTLGK